MSRAAAPGQSADRPGYIDDLDPDDIVALALIAAEVGDDAAALDQLDVPRRLPERRSPFRWGDR
jgi:hypothetical protein